MANTKLRPIRLDDDLWAELGTAAKAAGLDRTAILRQLAEWYCRRPGVPLPERPISPEVARRALAAHEPQE